VVVQQQLQELVEVVEPGEGQLGAGQELVHWLEVKQEVQLVEVQPQVLDMVDVLQPQSYLIWNHPLH
jgi:hypothetical protein